MSRGMNFSISGMEGFGEWLYVECSTVEKTGDKKTKEMQSEVSSKSMGVGERLEEIG